MAPKDLLALIIGVGILLWGFVTIIGLIWHGKSLGEAGGEFFIAIGGVLAGAIATYMATRNNHKGE